MGSEQLLSLENTIFTIVMVLYLIATVLYFMFFALKNEKMGKAAGVLISLGFVFHTIALVVRGLGAGRLPMTNQYEFATSFAWGICLCFLVFLRKYHFDAL